MSADIANWVKGLDLHLASALAPMDEVAALPRAIDRESTKDGNRNGIRHVAAKAADARADGDAA